MAFGAEVPQAVIEDRKQFFTFMDFSRLTSEVPHLFTQLRANAALIDAQLADGRLFLLGNDPGWADITCYFTLWMARHFVPSAAPLLSGVTAWQSGSARS